MSSSRKIRNVFHLLGYDEDKRGLRLVPIIMNTLGTLLCISAISYIAWNENNRDRMYLLMASKDINNIICLLGCSLQYMFMNENMKHLLQIIDTDFLKYGKSLPMNQKRLVVLGVQTQTKTLHNIGVLMIVTCVLLSVLPGLGTTYIIYKHGLIKTNITSLPLPIIFQFPKNYDVIQVYVVIYVIQIIYFADMFALGYCIFGALTCSLQFIILDIKLFCINLYDLDFMIAAYSNKQVMNFKLHNYGKFLVQYHQRIRRNVKLLTSSVSMLITICNQSICFEVCVFLYCTAEVETTFEKIGCCTLSISFSVVLLIYCNCGQRIINAGEEIRDALYECPWLDKPEWFKKDLYLIMTMANMPLHVKPHGLYILNLKTFTSIINAAYTYFNALRTLKK